MDRKTLVMKFGGTSLASIDHLKKVASRIEYRKNQGFDPVVVVSAMAGETDRLHRLAKATAASNTPENPSDEFDVVLTAGEQISAGLLSLTLRGCGLASLSFLGYQLPILTTDQHEDANILSIDVKPIREAQSTNAVPIIAGFQGVNNEGRITSLGRGGSDLTAVALAAALGTKICEVYTDVAGVYSHDPNRGSEDPIKYRSLSYAHMLRMATNGANVLHHKSVKFAAEHKVKIHVRSTFSHGPGTWIGAEPQGCRLPSFVPQRTNSYPKTLVQRDHLIMGGLNG